jgi:hypothetical protein
LTEARVESGVDRPSILSREVERRDKIGTGTQIGRCAVKSWHLGRRAAAVFEERLSRVGTGTIVPASYII